MKKLFFATAILFATVTVNAQNANLKFGAGLNIGIPAHNLSGTSLGVGVDVIVLYSLSKQAALTGDFGYTALFGKNSAPTTSLLPLRVGLRYYPSDDFYVAGKIGAGFLSSSYGSSTTTAYSFGAGYKIDPQLEIGASYDGYSKNGTIGLVNLRLGYFFK